MLATPFLTQLDSRAAVKGSRDPLGVQSIWSRLGRGVVGNLTTVTNSVRDFTVLLLGYYFVERVADEGGTEGDLATFLKWEQLAAYARAHISKERGFRGTERVWKRLADGTRVRLGVDSDAQILGNQQIYGLWGLYSVAARSSGLLQGDPARLTDVAREIVERVHLPMLGAAGVRQGRAVVERLLRRTCSLDLSERSKDTAVLAAVARVLAAPIDQARAFYREHLLYGGPGDSADGTQGVQRIFADLLTGTLGDEGWTVSAESIGTLASRARQQGAPGSELARRLDRMRTCELLIAPSVALFEYAIGCDGQTPRAIADAIRQQWRNVPSATVDLAATAALEPDLTTWADDTGARWVRLAGALHGGSYDDALLLVLEQNAAVMAARSGAAPWASIRDDKLYVRFRDEHLPRLPDASELPNFWRHAYFIASLRDVARALRG